MKYLIFTLLAALGGGVVYLLGRQRTSTGAPTMDVGGEAEEAQKELSEARQASQQAEERLDEKITDAQSQADETVADPPDDLGDAYDDVIDELRADDPAAGG